MKEKYVFRTACIILVIALIISLYNIFNSKKTTFEAMFGNYYNLLETNIKLIETNMNEITTSNDNFNWSKLKKIDDEDKQLKDTYNLLVADIRNCYLLSNDLKNKTYSNPKILNFKNRRRITEKEISKLAENKNCLEDFDKYNSMVLSSNQKLSNRIKNQISVIIEYRPETINNEKLGDMTKEAAFIELLNDELYTTSKIASLTSWLKVEYYSRITN